MSELVLITGGSRSGRSSFAVALARGLGESVGFLATCDPGQDSEMLARVAAHRAGRPPKWDVREVEIALAQALSELRHRVVILDDIPTWISNLLVRGDPDSAIEAAFDELQTALDRCPARLLLVVTAEVGAGLIPDTLLGRRFRDLAGSINRRLAAVAARVYWMCCGLPTQLPKHGYSRILNDLKDK